MWGGGIDGAGMGAGMGGHMGAVRLDMLILSYLILSYLILSYLILWVRCASTSCFEPNGIGAWRVQLLVYCSSSA